MQVRDVLEQMLQQQEPYPLTVLDGDFRVFRSNRGAQALFRAFVAEPSRLPPAPDLFTLFFDPALLRPFVEEWPEFARRLLGRLHRELLQRGGDERLRTLLARILAFPDIPPAWRHPDFSEPAPAVQSLRLKRDDLRVGFLVTITKFSAPQQVMLDELSVESCFPLDAATRTACSALVG